MHDLLYFFAVKQGKYDVELSNLDSIQGSTTRHYSRGELQINKNRLVRSDENFFNRTKILYNLVLKIYSNYDRSLNKNTVSKIFWQFFCNQSTEENKCTWRIVCKCGNCNINQKHEYGQLNGSNTLKNELRSLIYYCYYYYYIHTSKDLVPLHSSFCSPPQVRFARQLQSTCHYIVNHYVKIGHVRLGGHK